MIDSLAFLGEYHVLVIHFPIALLLAAGLAEVLDAVTGRGGVFALTSVYCLVLGTCGALLAAGLGWLAHHDYIPLPGLEETFEEHEVLGYWTAGLALAAAVLRFRSDVDVGRTGTRRLYLGALLALTVVLVLTAQHGGELNH